MEQIFEALMDLPEEKRAAFLVERCAGDTELRREVASLAEHVHGAETFLAVKMDRALSEACGWSRAGQRIGPYRLEKEIGSGGMATVYLASRDDGQFRQQVAVKLVKYGMDSAWSVNRFLCERQVLASLVHPNIARLLDGGSTEDGLPYLVMEYIEGNPITVHSKERGLPLESRLKLFLGVCEAVSHAHRNLVVHRDIKPGNILVTREGVPKLLDFGISKLLDPLQYVDSQAPTAAVVRLMTPEYASPEQVKGEAITTATDVYSLGAVLYELLTGQCPYRFEVRTPGEFDRLICHTEPARPSDVAEKNLAGDLDNIVQKAMRKEPERRYSSVEQLAQDIRRYLEGLPVSARSDSFSYRAWKFVRRHKAGVAAGMLLALSLIGGMTLTLWQARRVAQQVQRAERQFLLFRKLGNAFLFDLHEKIQKLKDVSEARELILNTSIEYIDGLAREAGDDPIFRREIGRAYEKIGDLQGFRNDSGLGRPSDALINYRKAIAILEPVGQATAATATLILLSRSYCSAGEMIELTAGVSAEATDYYRRSIDVTKRIFEIRPNHRSGLETFARANHLWGDAELARRNGQTALDRYISANRAVEAHRETIGVQTAQWLADGHRRIGRLQATLGDDATALDSFRKALALAREADTELKSFECARALLLTQADLIQHLAHMRGKVATAPELRATRDQMLSRSKELASAFPNHPHLPGVLRAVERAAGIP